MTRPVDAHKEYRSWVVVDKDKKKVLVQSHWAPGYTEAYKATPEEAVEYATKELRKQINRLSRQLEDFELEVRRSGVIEVRDRLRVSTTPILAS